jgi:hypothetical protein
MAYRLDQLAKLASEQGLEWRRVDDNRLDITVATDAVLTFCNLVEDGHGYLARFGIDLLDLAQTDLDALSLEALERALDARGIAQSDHQPQERGSEQVLTLAVNEHDAMLTWQSLP